MKGKLALQCQHSAVAAVFRFEFFRTHFNGRRSACPISGRGLRDRDNALARPRRRVDQCGVGVVVEVYRRTHDRLPCFHLRSHKESVDLLQLLTFADCNVTNSYDSCSLAAQEGIGSHRELPTGRVGVQTFAGLGAVDLSRYWQPTGALGRTTELQGLSRDR